MPIDVRARNADGSEVVYRVNTDDPEEARRRARAEHSRRQSNQAARQQAQPPQPNAAQQREAGGYAADRLQRRQMMPFGLGHITQPIVNMLESPARRQELARSAQGAWNDVQQLPNIDWGRVARETGNNIQQGTQNLPQTLGAVAQNIPQIARGVTYGPFADEERAMRQMDMARILGDEEGERQAAQQANAQTASASLNVAAPALFARPMSMLQAGGTAGAVAAPFALSRNSDQPLQERLPDAITETTGAAAFGAGAQGVVNTLPRIFQPTRAQNMVERMDRAGASVDAQGAPQTPRGVTPSLATANRGAGASSPATNLVADNIFAGAPTRGRLRRSAEQTRDAVHDVRDAYGRARGREDAGRVVQRGLARYADDANAPNPSPGAHPRQVSTREWSFPAQANAVFDEALRPIASNQAPVTQTRRVIGQLLRRADDPGVLTFQADPVLRGFVETLTEAQQGGRSFTLRDLRELRRRVREAQTRPRLGPEGVDNGALQRLEQALTEDIYAAAGSAADNLRRADTFYRRGMTRIEGVRRFFDPENPASSIQQILRAANPRTENARVLAALRSALPDREWRVVAASIIDEMGAPLPGAKGFVAEQSFSIERFATAYRAMTPRARRIIFGSRGGQGGQSGRTMRALADDLDNLAAVADAQKGVMAGANSSGSATHLQNIGSIGLMLNPATAGGTLFALVGGLLTGEILTNPAFVRWLVSARRAGAPSGMRRHLAQLRDLAARDPALYPVVAELESRLEAQRSERAPDAAGDPASTPRQREPAFR